MLKFSESPKNKLPKFTSQEGELKPEHYAIRIQAEFLMENPELESVWVEKVNGVSYSELFRNFFNTNTELCMQLFHDPEKKKDLFEIIRNLIAREEQE